jgi:hypothetical protein
LALYDLCSLLERVHYWRLVFRVPELDVLVAVVPVIGSSWRFVGRIRCDFPKEPWTGHVQKSCIQKFDGREKKRLLVLRMPDRDVAGRGALRGLQRLRGRIGPPLPVDQQVHSQGEPGTVLYLALQYVLDNYLHDGSCAVAATHFRPLKLLPEH